MLHHSSVYMITCFLTFKEISQEKSKEYVRKHVIMKVNVLVVARQVFFRFRQPANNVLYFKNKLTVVEHYEKSVWLVYENVIIELPVLKVVMITRHYSEVDNFAVKTKIPEIWPRLKTTRH